MTDTQDIHPRFEELANTISSSGCSRALVFCAFPPLLGVVGSSQWDRRRDGLGIKPSHWYLGPVLVGRDL